MASPSELLSRLLGRKRTTTIRVYDATVDHPLVTGVKRDAGPDSRCEIWIRGEGSWYPVFRRGAAQRVLDYSKPRSFAVLIFPDGRGEDSEPAAAFVRSTGFWADEMRIDVLDHKILVSIGGAPQTEHPRPR